MELSEADLGTVLNEVFDVRAKWYNIGLGLRVPAGTLDAIRGRFDDPADCLRETLREWLRQAAPQPTWRALVEALRSRAVGEQQLARALEGRYGLPEGVRNPNRLNDMQREHQLNGRRRLAVALQKIVRKL